MTTEAAGEFGHCRKEEMSVTVHRGPAVEAGQYWEEVSVVASSSATVEVGHYYRQEAVMWLGREGGVGTS